MFPVLQGVVPTITTEQMIEVDRAMIEDYGIKLEQMMENAGLNLARLARSRFLGGNPMGRRVLVLVGTGGNGGGAMVCARRLHNWGAEVEVYLTKSPTELTPVPRWQHDILAHKKVPIFHEQLPEAQGWDLVIDGLIGYSLSGNPRGRVGELIHCANELDAPILSLDTPSGIGLTTGEIYNPVINATATMTLALPKAGLVTQETNVVVGELYLADISVPPELYSIPSLGLEVDYLFAESEVLRIRK